ncbi:DUF6883 domain-containing protein [Prochlorothrix hollandica]|uniref:DUF6883 domain-containing protein n=1 Tax=Prochlorothrix hollandica PCC 9006 = CALU 1027 TaxID=317619 RepID=A0A0M2PWW5_PROHO|nr:DUF6883 domain-containing protein [Prochlorothrix hollandica]KKI99178.1 hypothetical protein PROH_15595 [Prochlorothrix hollandica PCC 9006 = CALU 1027]
MKLPQGDHVDPRQVMDKLLSYSLNFNHDSGKHKARLFQSKLGITIENQQGLASAICEAAATSETVQFTGSDQYGDRYVMIFQCVTAMGTSDVLTAWIVRHGESIPRLTSTYPLRS